MSKDMPFKSRKSVIPPDARKQLIQFHKDNPSITAKAQGELDRAIAAMRLSELAHRAAVETQKKLPNYKGPSLGGKSPLYKAWDRKNQMNIAAEVAAKAKHEANKENFAKLKDNYIDMLLGIPGYSQIKSEIQNAKRLLDESRAVMQTLAETKYKGKKPDVAAFEEAYKKSELTRQELIDNANNVYQKAKIESKNIKKRFAAAKEKATKTPDQLKALANANVQALQEALKKLELKKSDVTLTDMEHMEVTAKVIDKRKELEAAIEYAKNDPEDLAILAKDELVEARSKREKAILKRNNAKEDTQKTGKELKAIAKKELAAVEQNLQPGANKVISANLKAKEDLASAEKALKQLKESNPRIEQTEEMRKSVSDALFVELEQIAQNPRKMQYAKVQYVSEKNINPQDVSPLHSQLKALNSSQERLTILSADLQKGLDTIIARKKPGVKKDSEEYKKIVNKVKNEQPYSGIKEQLNDTLRSLQETNEKIVSTTNQISRLNEVAKRMNVATSKETEDQLMHAAYDTVDHAITKLEKAYKSGNQNEIQAATVKLNTAQHDLSTIKAQMEKTKSSATAPEFNAGPPYLSSAQGKSAHDSSKGTKAKPDVSIDSQSDKKANKNERHFKK
jgi:predicted transposase YbfD/YdcC